MKNAMLMAVGLAVCMMALGGEALGWQTESCPRYFQMTAANPSSCLFMWSPVNLPDPNLPVTAVCCNPAGIPFGESCAAPKPSCGAPANADRETCLACNGNRTPKAAKPIDLATGNTYITQSDISVPGTGGGLTLSLVWNSLLPAAQNTFPFMFGAGWRSNYEEHLVLNSPDSFVKYLRGDGSVWSFGVTSVSGPDVYRAAAPADDSTGSSWVNMSGSPTWTLTSKSGEKKIFDATSGTLLSITDRNGNVTQLSYDGSGRLSTVTDPALRHLYFNYANSSTPLVSSVTSDVGITLAYTYDAQGRLTQVTRPDGTTESFEYNAQSLISAVKDSDGKVLESHTYDAAGRGLTASRAGGVDSVTISYPQ